MNYGSKEWQVKHFTVKSVVHKTATIYTND